MAVKTTDVQDRQTLSNRIESIPPKLVGLKSHPYLNTHPLNTPPLPKPIHFHQLSDQTGQSSHNLQHTHQSTVSLPTQTNQIRKRFDFSKPQPQIPSFNNFNSNQNYQAYLNKQPIYYNDNIEQYETTFTFNDLDKRKDNLYNQQIYMNQAAINYQAENFQSNSSDSSPSFINNQINEYTNQDRLNYQKSKDYNPVVDNQNLSVYHGLPMKFVKALKRLFDIFDVNKSGLIRLIDIETKINEEKFDEELDRPQDLIDSLRKVTSPNGFLNFSNFIAAINICLLKNQLAKSKQQQDVKLSTKSNDRNDSYLRAQSKSLDESLSRIAMVNGYSSNPFLNNTNKNHKPHKYKSSINSNSPLENSSFTSTNSGTSSNSSSRLHKDLVKMHLKPNQNNQQTSNKLKYRPSSVPVDEADYYKSSNDPCLINRKLDSKAKSMGNLKEQIYANKLRQCSSESRIQNNVLSSQEIMNKLIEWRNNLLEKKLRKMNNSISSQHQSIPPPMPILSTPVINQPNYQLNNQINQPLYSVVNKRTINYRKREEARRHTVTSLHSLNTMKKLTNLQREKNLLEDGIDIIERGKQFYLRQIAIVQNQIDALNQCKQNGSFFQTSYHLNSEYNLEQHLEKLNSLGLKNKQLVSLIDELFPNQLNRSTTNLQNEIEIQKQNLTIFKLKEQIRVLNEELSRKTNIILNLEQTNPFLNLQNVL